MKPSAELVQIITAQERALIFPSFTADDAFALGARARERVRAAGAGAVIAVELFDGHTLFRCAVGGGLGPDNWCAPLCFVCVGGLWRGDRSWVARKLNTVRRFGRSSFLVGRQNDLKGGAWHVDPAEYADHGGAFPIRIQVRALVWAEAKADKAQGVQYPIGALIVSGLPQEEDHDLAVKTIAEHLGLDVPSVI
jgi:uncharacterized protein (UPF0303 family)